MIHTEKPRQRWNATGADDTDSTGNLTPRPGVRHGAADPEPAFRNAMAAAGLVTSAPIVADGALHRFHVEGDRRGSRNAWYVLHADPPISGAFGSWKLAVSGTWTAGDRDRLTRED
nr:hypothetical protein [Gemmatimonadota bacterium]